MGSKSLTQRSVEANEERTAIALREAAVLMQPIALWLLRSGVTYGAFADLLKAVFVNAARHELQRGAAKVTNSALSVASGVHRKDVRALAESADATEAAQHSAHHSVSLASQVFTRWLTDARYRDRSGRPRHLARSGSGVSFESLARSVSSDIHPRTVLEELIRLGLVRLGDDKVVPTAQSFVPSQELGEMTALFSANTADHLAAGVHNLTLEAPKFLEQSIFATGLSEASVERLHQAARSVWTHAFETMMSEGRDCIAADGEVAESFRMRFGVYYYGEPMQALGAGPEAAEPAEPAEVPTAKSRGTRDAKTATARSKPATRRRKTP